MFPKVLYVALSVWFITTGVSLQLQAQDHPLSTVERIESQINMVARTMKISTASVCMKDTDNFQSNTSTFIKCPISMKEFTVSNGFLQIGSHYFNLEKLLYFKVEEDRRTKQAFLEFHFQSY